ncbi:Adenosine deaminase-related growth factor C [Daphnia magna]|uniref:Adenosine deaminase n=1 Tax=Daphnia magna TaxID=35525 RepID=A0A164TNU8_9CRUS|nr:Adenosine deaminase-related growth factor C [Daphnia magna]
MTRFVIFSSVLLVVSLFAPSSLSVDVNEFLAQRERFLADESARILGGGITLSSNEELVNTMLMTAKTFEYDQSFSSLNFTPATHFFLSKPAMLESEVFQFIRQMPKGGVLHIHDVAVTPLEFIIYDASYRPNLYVCSPPKDPVFFQYASPAPANLPDCDWTLVADRRAQEGALQFDAWLRSKLSLYTPNPQEAYPNINSVWTAFENTLIAGSGIITFAPVFTDYFYEGLQSFYDDNVQYIEIRTTLPQVYNLDGTLLDEAQVTQLYKDTFDRFRNDHPDFTGAKIIFAPLRRADNATMSRYVELASQLKAQFPDVVAGFDLVGQEDLGPPLKEFLSQLLAGAVDPNLHYFFHAGETNWHGTDVDENLIDAILLNTTRIGHGFAIAKHPSVMELARSNGVPVEICPISNQVLALVDDLRNHPAAMLFSNGFPLVISSDDPASWDAVALSSDFYMAFMGLAGKKADLRTLKQLAINSIMFSAMTTDEKNSAMAEWQRRWNDFILNKYEDYKTKHNLI